jgi:SHS2 domain-containing protein
MHAWVEHTAELELRIEAPEAEAVFAEALAALAELLDDGDAEAGERVERDVELEAPDLPALLAAWIDELAYLAETEDLVPLAARRLELDGCRLAATVAGRRGVPRHLVKGATYHRLAFAREGERYVATVVLDV